MQKEYFFKLFDQINIELDRNFSSFLVENREYRTEEEGNKLNGCEAIFKLIATNKYINLWFGVSIYKTKPFSITIAVCDNKSDYSFPLTDYLAIKSVHFDKSLLFHHLKNYEDAIEVSKQLFEELKKLIATEEMQKLLYTDYKIDVPRDYSPYK